MPSRVSFLLSSRATVFSSTDFLLSDLDGKVYKRTDHSNRTHELPKVAQQLSRFH